MKCLLCSFLLALSTLLPLGASENDPASASAPPERIALADNDERPFVNNPNANGLSVDGFEEALHSGTILTITFPAAMVTQGMIDAEDVESPIDVWPSLDANFIWRTQSQGELIVRGPLIPGQSYHFRLREGAKDATGSALQANDWGFEMFAPMLRVIEEGYGERSSLNATPQVPLAFNYPVRLSDAASGIWFQDRASRERFPAEILLNVPEGEMANAPAVDATGETDEAVTAFRARPLKPLPVGRRYDLVVDGICDSYGGRALPYPQVFPLGVTRPLRVDYVAARNPPLEAPHIEVKFDQLLGETVLPKDVLEISPPVSKLRIRMAGPSLIAEGDFDPNARYLVTVSNQVQGVAGYGLSMQERWGASFRPKHGAILFPERQIRQRSVLGLNFAFYHVNTTGLEWRLAAIPLEKLAGVLDREREFTRILRDAEGEPVWTKQGIFQRESSEPLISSLELQVLASGNVPAAGDAEVLREITWKPEDPSAPTGPALLEVTGRDSEGRIIGNRAVIYFGEVALTRKVTRTQSIVRAARLTDGKPLEKSTVFVLGKDLKKIAGAITDANGLAAFDMFTIAGAQFFACEGTIQPISLSDQFSGGILGARPPASLRAYTMTDRPIYRPGQSIQFKGFVREEQGGSLKIPTGRAVKWTIERDYAGELLATGQSKVDGDGGWSGSWIPPENAPVGEFVVKALVGGQPAGSPARFQIQEFRNPPFSVLCEGQEPQRPAESVITVQSQYFHGAPNAGSRIRWTATWLSDSADGAYYGEEWTRVDLYSEHAKRPVYSMEVSGEAVLDGNGQATLRCDAPFKDPGNRAHCSVVWKVDVTGPDGQTMTGGTTQNVAMAPVLFGVKRVDAPDGEIEFLWNAEEQFAPAPEAVDVELFHVQTKSVKERLAPDVYRYRNFDQYELVERREQVTEDSLRFKPASPGRYVALVSPVAGSPGFPVSEEAYLAGDEESEVPVESDTAARVFSVKGRENAKPWIVGEKAVLNVLSPTGGIAWVSVETDRILDTFTVPIQGNTSQIEIPVKSVYEPNVFVSVYVLRPGGSDQLAGEMYGYDQIDVQAPGRGLDVSVKTTRTEYEPREKISGEVTVTAAGRPVAGADLAIYAVDDSILTLGGWRLPQLLAEFFPARNLAVVTYSALKAYVDKIVPSWLTMKGFVAGDAGAQEFGNVTFTRKEFKPLILWRPSVRTDAKGIAKFDCEAPDDLTRFRVIAVGQTRNDQFGSGDTTFAVSKKLLIEPALPRFVREGDEIELRAVARQKVSESERLRVRCTTGGGLELIGDSEQEILAKRDSPAVVRFKARAKSTGPASVRFDAASTSRLSDSVEIMLPVAEPVILRKESVSGSVTGARLSGRDLIPPSWSKGRGVFTLAASTTPWLNKLMGLPFLLEYPHGCFEQKASRLLGYTFLGGLLEYLPDSQARKASYQRVIQETLREFEASLLADGRLPYWSGSTQPNDFVTIQAGWCVNQAEEAGFDIPERLSTELSDALESMVAGKTSGLPPTLRAFALFVVSISGQETMKGVTSAAEELFLHRDKLTGEGRAMLAIAMNNLGIEADKQRILVNELPKDFSRIEFNPETFSSGARTEALCTWARLIVEPAQVPAASRDRLLRLAESSASLSTQENFWLLVAFKAMMKTLSVASIKGTTPKPAMLSANASSASWGRQDLARLASFAVQGLKPGGSFVLKAEYRTPERQTFLVSQGIQIDRVVKNLTEASRDGSVGAPFRLGDQILISYRFSCERPQSYMALEDMIPAGLEIVNPNLALFGKYYSLPAGSGPETAALSHSEMRDQQTNLYFDEMPSGARGYSVLARATAAGSFIWPATQISPMYDSGFYGRSASSECNVLSE
ncbi:MAG: alpha-2-macroglobulin family protein [Terrimicrobiaceae bacterium]